MTTAVHCTRECPTDFKDKSFQKCDRHLEVRVGGVAIQVILHDEPIDHLFWPLDSSNDWGR